MNAKITIVQHTVRVSFETTIHDIRIRTVANDIGYALLFHAGGLLQLVGVGAGELELIELKLSDGFAFCEGATLIGILVANPFSSNAVWYTSGSSLVDVGAGTFVHAVTVT